MTALTTGFICFRDGDKSSFYMACLIRHPFIACWVSKGSNQSASLDIACMCTWHFLFNF